MIDRKNNLLIDALGRCSVVRKTSMDHLRQTLRVIGYERSVYCTQHFGPLVSGMRRNKVIPDVQAQRLHRWYTAPGCLSTPDSALMALRICGSRTLLDEVRPRAKALHPEWMGRPEEMSDHAIDCWIRICKERLT
jgi:hypothetical protein